MPSPNGIIGIVVYGFLFFMALLALFVPLFIFQMRDSLLKIKKLNTDIASDLSIIKGYLREVKTATKQR